MPENWMSGRIPRSHTTDCANCTTPLSHQDPFTIGFIFTFAVMLFFFFFPSNFAALSFIHGKIHAKHATQKHRELLLSTYFVFVFCFFWTKVLLAFAVAFSTTHNTQNTFHSLRFLTTENTTPISLGGGSPTIQHDIFCDSRPFPLKYFLKQNLKHTNNRTDIIR